METLVQADIFFFISSISTIIFTLLVSIALYYLIRALQAFKRISEELEAHLGDAGEYVKDITERVTESSVFNFLFPHKKKRTKAK